MTASGTGLFGSAYNREMIRKSMEQATSEAVESMVFAELTALEMNEAKESSEPLIRVKIALQKPLVAHMLLICPFGIAERMTQNMYAGNPELVNEETIADAMREMLNTIAGRVLEGVSGGTEEIALGIPESCPSYPLKTPDKAQMGVLISIAETDMEAWLQFIISP
jgi:hypothetical protein